MIKKRRSTRIISISSFCAVELVERRLLLSSATSSLPSAPPMYPVGLEDTIIPDSGGSSTPYGNTPMQVRTGYGLGAVGSSSLNFNGTVGNGTGETIAIIDAYDDPNAITDLSAFDTYFGLPDPPSFKVLNQSGQASPLPGTDPDGPNYEYGTWEEEESLDIEWSHVMAPDANIILYEANNSGSLYSAIQTADANSAVNVMSMSFASGQFSGESSYSAQYFSTPGITYLSSTGDDGAPAGFPAGSANVIAVGGTSLYLNSNNTYSSESGWSGSGGGIDSYESQPSYQAFTVKAQSTTNRTTPDVSILADPNTGVPIYDSWDFGASTPWIPGYEGGTSLASPLWAGLIADADQGRSLEGLGSLTGYSKTLPRLYQIPTSNYHDITTGNNGYAAGKGYDLVTGIGTPIANVLVPDLAGAGTITGRLFVDVSGNGIYGGNDTPLSGQTVYLDLNNDGVQDNNEPSTVTNSQGIYTFTDQPAGGSIRLVTTNPTGYTLSSTSAPSITYGTTDTANFTFINASSKLGFTQQPTNTSIGTVNSPISVAIQNNNGVTNKADTSTVTLTLSSGTFNTGSNTISVAAVAGVATFNNLLISAPGSYTLTATDGTLTSVVSNPFAITQLSPGLSWIYPDPISYGTPLDDTELDATANVPGTFVYTPSAGSILTVGTKPLSVTFYPTDVDYASASTSVTIVVTRAYPSITWPTPAPITYGTPLSSVQLDATDITAGTFTYSPAAGTVLGASNSQSLRLTFKPTDTTDYSQGTATNTIAVLQATPTLSWANPASIPYGTALSSTQLDATANVPGTFAYTPAAGTVLNPGANQSLGVLFTPTNSTNYTTASSSVLITVTGSATQPINLTGSTFYLKLDNATPQNLDIWTNSTATGTPADVQAVNTISSITLSANAVGDSFIADFSNGNIVPGGGLIINGFGSASSNSLTVVGTGGSDSVTVPGNGNYNINAQTVAYSTGTIGNVYFAPGGASEALSVPSGSVTLAPSTGNGITTDSFSSISIPAGATLVAPFAVSHANRLLIETSALSVAGSSSAWTGTLDLSNNDLDVANGNLAKLTSQVAQGYTTGTTGIISSAALSDTTHLTTLGVIQNSVDGTTSGTALYGTSGALGLFDGANPANTDVLVKYTYFGDANLSGSIDGSDYSRIDSAYGSSATGWFNGDFNYDGKVDGSDYTLIDNAFNQQGTSLQAQIAKPSAMVSASTPTFAPTPSLFSNTLIVDQSKEHRHQLVVDIGLSTGA